MNSTFCLMLILHILPFFLITCTRYIRLPRWHSGKESTCQCRRCGFSPWVRKIPWRQKWQPTAVFLPGKSHGQRSLAGCSQSVVLQRVRHALATKRRQLGLSPVVLFCAILSFKITYSSVLNISHHKVCLLIRKLSYLYLL